MPHSLASILFKYLFLSISEKVYYFFAFERNTPTQEYFWKYYFSSISPIEFILCIIPFNLFFFFPYNQYKLLCFAFLSWLLRTSFYSTVFIHNQKASSHFLSFHDANAITQISTVSNKNPHSAIHT